VVEISDAQKTEEKIESAIVSALIDIFTVPHLLFVAMGLVFASLVSALMLFGFSDSMANSYPIVANVFQSVLSFSIFTLVLGFYMTIRVLQDLTTKMEPQKIAKALGKALENIEQDLKKATAKKE
jgi:uncharacterized protein YacL